VLGELGFDTRERSGHDSVGVSGGFPEEVAEEPSVGRGRREQTVGSELAEGPAHEAFLDSDFSRDSNDFPFIEPLRARVLRSLFELELDCPPDHPVEVAPRHLR
jgi:hypothetical protein